MTHINDELDYIRGKIQKNVKYNLTVDNKAQYYNVTKNLQRAILMSEVTFKIFLNDNDKLK